MIPLAQRYSRSAIALLAIAVIAVALHRALAAHVDPCADPDRVLHLDAYGHDYKVEEHLGTGDRYPQQRLDGTLPPAVPGGGELWFRVVRADEPFPIYSKSFLITLLLPEDRSELRELRVGSDALPVHRVFDDSLGKIRLTRYYVVHGVRPVAHLLRSGIATAWQQLLHGTLPVTVFVVTGTAETAETLPAVEGAAEAWLSAAWSDFRAACRPWTGRG